MQQAERAAEVIIGVDTHKDTHTAVALDALGARLGTTIIPVSREGYRQIEAWAGSFGPVLAFGIECTGSYGAGLSRALRASGHRVLDVDRPDRSARRRHGKDDPLDAEAAARAVLSGQATTLPKAGTSSVEMVRHLKLARDGAVKARAQAMQMLKAIIVSAPAELRDKLCGACPVPASSGRTSRHRLKRGGNRQANTALHRVVVTRMRCHRPTIDYQPVDEVGSG